METVFETIRDALMKAVTFLTSRRVWFFGLVAAVLAVLGFAGLNPETARQLLAALSDTADATIALIVALVMFVERLAALFGLIVVAYKTMSSLDRRPPTLSDYQ